MPLTPLPPSVFRKILELDYWELLASGPYSWTFGSKGKILPPVPNNVDWIATDVLGCLLKEAEISDEKYQRLLGQAKSIMGIVALAISPEAQPSTKPTPDVP